MTPNEYIQSYIPGRNTLDQGLYPIPKQTFDQIKQFGALTFGDTNTPSIFTAIKLLARENESVKHALTETATPIGKRINDAILENPHDPWFDTLLLYRPDMLISKQNHIYCNELEIVVGGINTLSLLYRYHYGQPTLLTTLIQTLYHAKEAHRLEGHIAFLADQNGLAELACFKWIPKELDKHIIVAEINQLTFKQEGVFYQDKKIACAYVYIKAHKLTQKTTANDLQLLTAWLERKILLASPPTLLLDNKLIINLLTDAAHQPFFKQHLSEPRLEKIRTYLPRSYSLSQHEDTAHIDHILEAPWQHGRFIAKYPSLWGSQQLLLSPRTPKGHATWYKRIKHMLTKTSAYGRLILQEYIDVQTIPVPHRGKLRQAKTKFTPFFSYRPWDNTHQFHFMAMNATPFSIAAHIDKNSQFALVLPHE